MPRDFGFKKLVEVEGGMKNTLLTGLAELVGTAILVFIGCMGCVASLGVTPSHLQIALTFGLAVMLVIQSIGHISQAHVNPAITVGAVILGKKTLSEAVVYLLSQLIGAVLGYGMLKVVTPAGHLTSTGSGESDVFCVTDLHGDLSAIQGLLVEGIATGILMLVACAVWDPKNVKNTDSVPVRFGLAVAVLATAFGPYTGCSMNPARSFGPALWNNQWTHHWIYWFGPIGGSLLVSFLYKTTFGARTEEEESGPESVALNTVTSHK
ncbi:aquaporin-like isoform X2 [Nomia melanderi]|uniref:aquaporin-like isoform X2 n=1 Tax=Nomia melanderi TaxID=2448451 RepID=UPI001304000F|nr:aquaporin-like isoform X2 [Nomia melanderi]